MKKILDACCGSRMFWFDKNNENVVFMDNRQESCTLQDGRKLEVNPDVIGDFTKMPFDDETFYLVVFDPPHLLRAGKSSWLVKKYGILKDNWQDEIQKGFIECMRVLKKNGTLVFKWSEQQVRVSDILKAINVKPLFGTRRGKTIFLVFMKS